MRRGMEGALTNNGVAALVEPEGKNDILHPLALLRRCHGGG